MASRKRKAIRRDEYLAAALACLLPQEQRDELRAARAPAAAVLRLFSPDHIQLHSLGGSDAWWNLHPRRRPEHAEKSRRDTAIVAKVKRLAMPRPARQEPACAFSTGWATKPAPKRKIASRTSPWPPRGSRPFRGRKATRSREVGSAPNGG